MLDKKTWDSFQCEQLNKTEKGKLVLCYSKNDGDTRIFVHRFSEYANATTKDGWWDTFTISTNPCKKGFHICRINSFRIDRNGYLNNIVTSIGFIGENVDEESIAWDLFFSSGLFCSEYKTHHYALRYNSEYLFSLYKEQIEERISIQKQLFGDDVSEWQERYLFFLFSFIEGKITLSEIEAALNEKDNIEKLADDLKDNIIYHHFDKYDEYPLIVSKISSNEDFRSYNAIEHWIRRKDIEYDTLKLGDETNILSRIEAVLEYWESEKKRKKEEKKAKRKEKKSGV